MQWVRVWLAAGACVQANASERPFPPSAACSDSAFPLSSQRVLDVPQTVSPCEHSPLYPLRIMIDSAMQSSCCMHSPAPIALDEGSLQPHIRVKTGAASSALFLTSPRDKMAGSPSGRVQSTRHHSTRAARCRAIKYSVSLPLVGAKDDYYRCIDSDLL